jgi:uncharacterized protein (TIGR02757 family)
VTAAGATAPPSTDRGRLTAVREALLAVEARCDKAARRDADPVGFVHRYEAPADKEIVALLASCFAFGNVKALRAKIADALARLGPSPAASLDDAARTRRSLRGFKHRLYDEHHVAALLLGARRVQRQTGSLGAALAGAIARADGDLVGGLVEWVGAIRRLGGLDRQSGNGAAHILPNPRGGGANKRLMLLLRWMVRPADGVDLGLWPIPASKLVIPLDVHLHKLGKNLGFVRVKAPGWKAAVELTRSLAAIDPADPTRFDFSLCHLGMVQRCPSRKDPVRCEGCGVRPICRHWAEN